ncbi:MAG: 50S ribosomal protein L24 [bacterium]
MSIKKGDKVKILKGRDRGKIGKVLSVAPGINKLTVEGLNLSIKNAKPRKQGEKGQRIQYPAPLDFSSVMAVCPKCSQASRLGVKILEDKSKVRVCRKCQEVID